MRVYEGKQQSKQFIIYDLDSIVRVNDRRKKPNVKKKCEKYAPPRLDLATFEHRISNLNPEL